MGGVGGGLGEGGEVAVFDFGDFLGDFADVGGFAALAAVGNGGQVRAIGFEHEFAELGFRDGAADALAVLEGDDAGEADERAEGGDAFLDFG